MAEDKVEPREINWRHLLPWTVLFQGFRVALDLNKLLLAAGGILATAIVWWLLAFIFYYPSSKPVWGGEYSTRYGDQAWAHFKSDLQAWNVLHAAAGLADSTEAEEAADLATTATEYELLKLTVQQGVVAAEAAKGKTLEDIKADARAGRLQVETKDGLQTTKVPVREEEVVVQAWKLLKPRVKESGQLRTLPWDENRHSNPFLLVTGKAGSVAPDGTRRTVPWEKGQFLEWMVTEQVPVLLEPLIKMMRPILFLFNPHASAVSRLYFLLVTILTVAIWGLVGGAITRIAVVQVARQEKIGAREALHFAAKRYLSFISAPLFPLILVAVIVLAMILFGLTQMVPILGEVLTLLYPLMLLAGLGMIVVLVGLVGWPLMSATVSAEGTDSWEAVSRSYSYLFGAPWHYLFYAAIALVYGAVLVFFVGFMGSAMVYFAKWGVQQTPFIGAANRDPTYLFAYAPTSYEWRALLMDGAKVDGQLVVKDGSIDWSAWRKFTRNDPSYQGEDRMTWYNQIGAFFVMIWLFLLFLLILGFGYSYFWSASTIIYLLMRRKVDDTEMDEVYLEEEEQESPYGPSATFAPPKAATPAPAPANLTMVESPTLRTPPKQEAGSTAIQPPAPAAPPTASGDGNAPAPGGSPT